MNNKQYKKAECEVVAFDNSDVITTSDEIYTGCKNRGHETGNGCSRTSGDCPGQFWKD